MHLVLYGPGRLGRSIAAWMTSPTRPGVTVHLLSRHDPLPLAPGEPTVIWLTVPDGQIASASQDVAAKLVDVSPVGTVVVAHASGATDLSPVEQHAAHGSLHPLMSFPGPEVALPDLQGVPAAVSGSPTALPVLQDLAHAMGLNPVHVPGARALYHAAAVLAGNAATVLLAQAGEALSAAGVPPQAARSLLLPLALRSLTQAAEDPVAALTGPVTRGDWAVLDAHRHALQLADLPHVMDTHDWFTRAAKTLLDRSSAE